MKKKRRRAAVITPGMRQAIIDDPRPNKVVAEEYVLSISVVSVIRRASGKTYPRAQRPMRLSPEQIQAIRLDPRPGTVVAREIGTHNSVVSGIRSGKLGRHVPLTGAEPASYQDARKETLTRPEIRAASRAAFKAIFQDPAKRAAWIEARKAARARKHAQQKLIAATAAAEYAERQQARRFAKG